MPELRSTLCLNKGGTNLIRPFEVEILREIRTHPRRPGAGGRSMPRKGVWIRGHLQDVDRDYPYSMYKRWKSFMERSGLNIEAGTYQQFRTYISVLRRLGLIEKAGGSPSSRGNFPRNYYSLIPDKISSLIMVKPLQAPIAEGLGFQKNFLQVKNRLVFRLNPQ